MPKTHTLNTFRHTLDIQLYHPKVQAAVTCCARTISILQQKQCGVAANMQHYEVHETKVARDAAETDKCNGEVKRPMSLASSVC